MFRSSSCASSRRDAGTASSTLLLTSSRCSEALSNTASGSSARALAAMSKLRRWEHLDRVRASLQMHAPPSFSHIMLRHSRSSLALSSST
eukprot:16394-Heterococcus_DN1.PRE.2